MQAISSLLSGSQTAARGRTWLSRGSCRIDVAEMRGKDDDEMLVLINSTAVDQH